MASDAHVGVHLPQSVADGGEVAAQVLHHVLEAARVFEQVHALRVRVVVNRERTLDRLRKLPVRENRQEVTNICQGLRSLTPNKQSKETCLQIRTR